jgi:hypothetical protein
MRDRHKFPGVTFFLPTALVAFGALTLLAAVPRLLAAEGSAADAVTVYWSCAGVADVYIGGKPLREAKPDFLTREDEPAYEYHASATLKVGDVITVGAKKGKIAGFRLAVFNAKNELVWQSETSNWRTYVIRDSRSAKRWYMPATAARARSAPVNAAAKEFPPPAQFAPPKADAGDSIWFQDADAVFLISKITARRNLVRLPLKEMNAVGEAKYFANGAQLDGLQPDDLDGSNRIKSYAKQPLDYVIWLQPPREIYGTVVTMAQHKGAFTWFIECADSQKDLKEKSGTYRQVTKPQRTLADQALDLHWAPIKAEFWQLNARSEGAQGPISLRKFELLVPEK